MIKNDELKELRTRAERTGEAKDWAAYAEALEARLETPHSALLWDPHDTEATKESAIAQEDARAGFDYVSGSGEAAVMTAPVQLVLVLNSGLLYAVEVRGQRSATAHGMQGLRPTRGALLRELNDRGVPVYFAFRDGGVWQTGWMEELGGSRPISYGEDGAKEETARNGWPVAAFDRAEHFRPPVAHEPREPEQGRLDSMRLA